MITKEDVREAVSWGWCHPTTMRKTMDVDLVEAITEEVYRAISTASPWLGYATTQALMDELAARARFAQADGKKWPQYRTVDNL